MNNSGRWAVKCLAEALEQISELSPACAGDSTETINAAVDAIVAGFPPQ